MWDVTYHFAFYDKFLAKCYFLSLTSINLTMNVFRDCFSETKVSALIFANENEDIPMAIINQS